MKMLIVFAVSLLITLPFEGLIAQEPKVESEALTVKVAKDVKRAANAAEVKPDEAILRVFANVAPGQEKFIDHVYATVSEKDRVVRLSRYFIAKAAAKTGPPSGTLAASDLEDFHWGYIAADTKYAPVRLQSPRPAKLVRVESMGNSYVFSMKDPGIRPDSVILLPAVTDPTDPNVTATFNVGNAEVAWTGSPAFGRMILTPASTTKGCEIYVNSDPPEATVYFNGRKYHARTNTSSIRPPGTWEVMLRLDRCDEWRDKRSVKAGNSWVITAKLKCK